MDKKAVSYSALRITQSCCFFQKLSRIKQAHLIGAKANIVGIPVFKSYLKEFKEKINKL